MIRRPPRSTLFPYTSSSDLPRELPSSGSFDLDCPSVSFAPPPGRRPHLNLRQQGGGAKETERSEEHTSELQSHVNLVCRLLLEKKKKHKQRTHQQYSPQPPQ